MNRIKINEINENPYLNIKLETLLLCKDYLDEWSNVTAQEVLEYRNVGKKTLRELRKFLAMYGITLKGDIVFDNEAEKKLIMDMPTHIKEMESLLREVDRRLRWVTLKLDELHCNMLPNDK